MPVSGAWSEGEVSASPRSLKSLAHLGGTKAWRQGCLRRAAGEGEGFQRAAIWGSPGETEPRGVWRGGRGASQPLSLQRWECEAGPANENVKNEMQGSSQAASNKKTLKIPSYLHPTCPEQEARREGHGEGSDSTTSWTIQLLFALAATPGSGSRNTAHLR